MGNVFGVAKISDIFGGCLKFLIFFGMNGRCWARAYVCRKNESTPLRIAVADRGRNWSTLIFSM